MRMMMVWLYARHGGRTAPSECYSVCDRLEAPIPHPGRPASLSLRALSLSTFLTTLCGGFLTYRHTQAETDAERDIYTYIALLHEFARVI